MSGSLIGGCVRKVRLVSERRAIAFAELQTKKHGKQQYPYACAMCRGWHVTTEVPLAQRLDQEAARDLDPATKATPKPAVRKALAASPKTIERERAIHVRRRSTRT